MTRMDDDTRPNVEPIAPYAQRTAARREQLEAKDAVDRRRFWTLAAVGAVLLLGFGWLAYRSYFVLEEDPDRALAAAVDALRAQVEQTGEEPVVPPAEDIVEAPDNLVAVPGPEGPEGRQGARGEPGIDGKDGQACLPSNPPCVGPSGPRGEPGETIEGPRGETGETGLTGEQGERGEKGEKGDAGADGRGVASVQVQEVAPNDCRLIVTYTDGSSQDAGAVDCPTPPLLPG